MLKFDRKKILTIPRWQRYPSLRDSVPYHAARIVGECGRLKLHGLHQAHVHDTDFQ